MRIGILTLHDSPNYGALLQAYALKRHLESLGHRTSVIDRRRRPDGRALRGPLPGSGRFRPWGLLNLDAHDGAAEYGRRMRRTLRFQSERLGLTAFHFHDWCKAPTDLGLDAIVIGSDQVWNADNHDPADYLPGRVPVGIPTLSYAASVGTDRFPADREETVRRGLAALRGIGVREHAAADLVGRLGLCAETVVDPVLLAGAEVWSDLLADRRAGGDKVLFYFLAEDFAALRPQAVAYARSRGARAVFFVDRLLRPAPDGWKGWWCNRRDERRWHADGADLRLDAGPEEFLRELEGADAVVSNSYHALMFSLLFGKPVRIVLPTHPRRRQMNARLTEAARAFADGPVVWPDLAAALDSLSRGDRVAVRHEALAKERMRSAEWLSARLEEIEGRCGCAIR